MLVVTILDACSMPLVGTLLDKLIVLNVDAQERARIMAILYAMVLIITSPFGWIAGQFSEVNRSYPFVLSIIFYALGIALTFLAGRPQSC